MAGPRTGGTPSRPPPRRQPCRRSWLSANRIPRPGGSGPLIAASPGSRHCCPTGSADCAGDQAGQRSRPRVRAGALGRRRGPPGRGGGAHARTAWPGTRPGRGGGARARTGGPVRHGGGRADSGTDTRVRAQGHTRIQNQAHTYSWRACTREHAHTHVCTCTRACMHAHACTHTCTHVHTCTRKRAHAHMHARTHTRACAQMRAHTCTHPSPPAEHCTPPPPQQLGTRMQLTTHCTHTHTHGILHTGTVHCTYPRPARCVHTLLPARMHSMHACCSPPALHVCWCCCAWARGRGGSAASESARVCTHVCVCVCVPGQKAQQNPRHSTWPCSRGLFAFLQGRGQILSRCRGPSPSLPRCIMQLGQAKPPRCVLVPPSSVPSPAATQSCHQGQPIARPVALEDSQMLAAAGTLSLGAPAELGTPRFGTPCPTVQGRGLAQVAPQGWRCAPVSCPPDLPLLLPSCASKSGRRMWSGREVARVGVPPCKCLGLPARLLTPCSS